MQEKTKTTIRRLSAVLALAWAVWVAIASLMPIDHLPRAPGDDKLQHLVTYGILAFLATLATQKRRAVLIACCVCIAMGGVIELLQPLSNRHCELRDFIANSAGVGLGALFAVLVLARLLRRT